MMATMPLTATINLVHAAPALPPVGSLRLLKPVSGRSCCCCKAVADGHEAMDSQGVTKPVCSPCLSAFRSLGYRIATTL